MMMGAVKCDNCKHVEQMVPCGKGGVKVNAGWLKVSPMITIQGTPHNELRSEAYLSKKNKLKEVIRHSHYCPACVELITGSGAMKLEWSVCK